jgi:hypothetical protein
MLVNMSVFNVIIPASPPRENFQTFSKQHPHNFKQYNQVGDSVNCWQKEEFCDTLLKVDHKVLATDSVTLEQITPEQQNLWPTFDNIWQLLSTFDNIWQHLTLATSTNWCLNSILTGLCYTLLLIGYLNHMNFNFHHFLSPLEGYLHKHPLTNGLKWFLEHVSLNPANETFVQKRH